MNTATSRESGLTVVEVIVSVVLFSLAIVSVVTLMQYAQFSQRDSKYVDIANNAARAQIELLRTEPFDNLNPASPVTFSSSSFMEGMPAGSTGVVTITDLGGVPRVKRLDAVVTYPVGTTTKTISITAYIDDTKEAT